MPGSDHDSFEFEPDFSDDELLATIFGDAANEPDGPDAGDGDPDAAESHRGAFGDFGGETSALIDRTFRERIIIVGVTSAAATTSRPRNDLDELALLVDTAGADVVGRVVQRRRRPDPATYIGKGKARSSRSWPPSTATPWCSTTS
jgi:GTP-binding protein HflX